MTESEPIIEEEVKTAPQPTPQPTFQPQAGAAGGMPMPNPGAANAGDFAKNYDMINNMSDDQLGNMVNTMKNNRELVRSQYERNAGMKLSDAQLD